MNKRIASIRAEHHMNQGEFAEKLGLTRNYISLIENGKREPSVRTIQDICRTFSVNEVWLKTGKGSMHLDLDSSYSEICMKIGLQDERAKQLIIRYFQLQPQEKAQLWKFVDTLFFNL